jgi:tRNA A-37 threonylcarbamoyl transferase component Bud32
MSRLAHALSDRYRIERELGQGGMATVYLAADLKHDRKVAIKVLKPELAAVLGAERFVVEIKTTASLQHPHILPLFDSGTADGFLFYVMPYIQGETIREKLNRETQFGVDEAVRIAREVADALDYAHRNGVIHRDIKPENILLHDGRAMVMDFGIALAVSAAAGGRMTETGLSLGTPHYMSPEQATADKEITGRSDIYSLASVLYEMLAGDPPFTASSAQAVIMKIITDSPRPVNEQRRNVPPNVADALAKALEKIPADRFENAHVFAQALVNPHFTTAMAAAPGRREGGRRSLLLMAVGATGLALASAIGGWLLRDTDPVPQIVRFSIPVTGNVGGLDVSADGAKVLVRFGGGVYLRALDDDSLHAMAPGITREPRLSRDGRSILGGAEDVIVVVDVAGGQPHPVVQTEPLSRAVFGYDGFVYFDKGGGLSRIAMTGGSIDTLLRADSSGRAIIPMEALPDGRSLLVILGVGTAAASAATDTVGLFDIATGRLTPLFPAAFSRGGVRYSATGHIVYGERSRILARTFDIDRRAVGDQVITLVDAGVDARSVRFAIGGHTLVYVASDEGTRALMLADRHGNRQPLANLPAGHYENPRISPSGDRIAVLRTDPNDNRRDLWVYDLSSARLSSVTRSGGIISHAWSTDGMRLAYSRGYEVFSRRFDASGDEEVLLRRPRRLGSIALTGDILVFQEGPAAWDVGVATLGRTGSDSLILHGDYWEGAPAVSRDGRWLAYYSAEGGQAQMFVQPFLRPGRKVQVSSTGSVNGRWSSDSRRLFYVQHDTVMEANLTTGADVAVASVNPLFHFPGANTGTLMLDVFPDGNRFAIAELQGRTAAREIKVVSGFDQLLRTAVPK